MAGATSASIGGITTGVTRTCRRFDYAGCGGNPNRFKSKNACFDEVHLQAFRLIRYVAETTVFDRCWWGFEILGSGLSVFWNYLYKFSICS